MSEVEMTRADMVWGRLDLGPMRFGARESENLKENTMYFIPFYPKPH